jgi:hypothetical protein
MGGRGSGGRRRGAGRKPKSAREHWLSGDAGKRGLALVERPADAGAKPGRRSKGKRRAGAENDEKPPVAAIGAAGEVPPILTPEERAWWELWAPLAVENGTLTRITAPGFVILCQTAADMAEIRADIRERGILTERKEVLGEGYDAVLETIDVKAHPLWPSYRGLKARLEQLVARYNLAPIGKAIEAEKADDDDERDALRRLLAVK